MLALGKMLGFEIKREPDSGDNELIIHPSAQCDGQATPYPHGSYC